LNGGVDAGPQLPDIILTGSVDLDRFPICSTLDTIDCSRQQPDGTREKKNDRTGTDTPEIMEPRGDTSNKCIRTFFEFTVE
ncbi:MAG: hypothetical protein ABEJ72_08385, partial [Candidatus Aenigmatarchaeota archaeon]